MTVATSAVPGTRATPVSCSTAATNEARSAGDSVQTMAYQP